MEPEREQSQVTVRWTGSVRAALDGATRKTLCCASSETSLLGCLPDEGGHMILLGAKLGDTDFKQTF